jgi:hypothetical protein
MFLLFHPITIKTEEFMLKRLPYFSVLISGLLTAQLIASVQVYLSNRQIYDRISAITQSGYSNMPKGSLLDMLNSWRPALGGGLFFTLSIGAGVTLLALALLWTWEKLCARNRPVLYLLIILWLALLGIVNRNGISLIPSLYFILVPWVVYFVFRRSDRQKIGKESFLPSICHLACITVLALVWLTQVQNGMFITIRDNLLLGNPVGIAINDFYYRYTHYSAEAISPLHRKMFKSYLFSNADNWRNTARVESVLSDYGYLQVMENGQEDIRIVRTDNQLIFRGRESETLLETPVEVFFNDPAETLQTVSQKSDRNFFFRRIIFVSLLIAFPITLYWLLHSIFNLVISFFSSHKRASLISTVLCCMVGSALILPVHWGGNRKIDGDQLPALLTGKSSYDHIAGLKTISQKNLEITAFATYRHLMESPHIAVRYWLARALGKSKKQETYQDLLALLQSSNPNVACQALHSIGLRGDADAIKIILDIVDTSDHWYVQRYAYQALRNLGWKHQRST